MEIIAVDYYNGNQWIEIDIPKLCPHCGVGNNPENKFVAAIDECAVYNHFCQPCKKFHYTLQGELIENKRTILMVYPNRVVAEIDPLFIENAPRFVEFYSEALQAEKLGLENIAGTGYRSAIECLIKDYALHFELDDHDYLANPRLTFNNAIDRYVKDDDLLKGALHFIREVGNHYTHWDKSTDISLPVLKSYVEIILQIFKSKFMLKHLPK
ncbi:TPA: DUF4145 domain-containing protein [Streptococcus suis]|nr:DUF4145 domain-containing protein [Streptococcus suis]